MKRFSRVALVTVLTVLMLPALSGTASAALVSDDPGVTTGEFKGSCNGVLPTPGSENTLKLLTGGSLVPGGTAEFQIRYPLDATDQKDDDWVVEDCVLIGTGSDLKDYEVLEAATFSGVSNEEFFELNVIVDIPADAEIGTSICNVAKTTANPSAPQASNRKAGPACFVIGGAARVEKRSTEDPDGEVIPGATFRISDCDNTAADPDDQPIFVTNGEDGEAIDEGETLDMVAVDGYLAFNGPAGSSCIVTEIAPPEGYALPEDEEDRSMKVEIPLSGTAEVFVFLDAPLVPEIEVEKTCPTEAVLVGDEIEFEITVTNTGTEPLENVVVTDELLGGVLDEFDSTLDVGESQTETFTRVALETDPASLRNDVTAEATGAETDEDVSDTDGCNTAIRQPDDEPLVPDVQIVKDGPDLAHVGDMVTYTFTVTNTGEVPLTDVSITDPLCDEDTLTDFEGDDNDNGLLDLNEEWTASCTHVVAATDGDPLPNTAVVNAIGGETPVDDDDDHLVDIIHPDIEVVKSASSTGGEPGDEITYIYVVTNTGDTTLFDISVDDDKLGHIGDIESLEPGESVTLEATTTLPAEAGGLTNIVVAVGRDELGEEVSDDDRLTVSVVLPLTPIRNEDPEVDTRVKDQGVLARTGSDVQASAATAGGWLLLAGIALLVMSRARRPRLASVREALVALGPTGPSWGAVFATASGVGPRAPMRRRDHGPPTMRDGP